MPRRCCRYCQVLFEPSKFRPDQRVCPQQRVYRLLDFTKRLRLTSGRAYCVAGKVNSVNTLYLVVESVKLDTKHRWSSVAPVPADGAGGSAMV